MEDDRTPRVQSMYDTHVFELGQPKAITRVVFYVGKHGPFEHDFPRGATRYDIELVMNNRRDSLPGGS